MSARPTEDAIGRAKRGEGWENITVHCGLSKTAAQLIVSVYGGTHEIVRRRNAAPGHQGPARHPDGSGGGEEPEAA